jgi:hypothetical protein
MTHVQLKLLPLPMYNLICYHDPCTTETVTMTHVKLKLLP